MVMQDKLVIRYRYSNETIEIDLSKLENESILFDFNEYDKIDVCLYSDAYIVELDCSAFRVKSQVSCCDSSFILQPSVEYSISDGNESQKVGYVPATYKINIFSKNGKVWNCYFKVRCNIEVEDNGMGHMIEQLESFIPGITIDFFREGPVLDVSKIKDYKLFWTNELLLKNYDELMYHSDYILYQYNAVDVEANQMLKMYIQKILYIVQSLSMEMDQYYQSKSKLLKECTQELQNYEDQFEMTLSKMSRNSLRSKKLQLKETRKDLKKWCTKLQDWQNTHDIFVSKLNALLYSPKLRDLDSTYVREYCPSFYCNVHYRFFLDVYNQINSMNYDCVHDFQMCTNKKTYQLYELYGMSLLHHLMVEEGLTLMNPEILDVFTFESDTILHYKGRHGFVDIYYDHFCPRKHETKEDGVVSVNSCHCKPDYMIVVMDGKHQMKDMFILDMKYRRLKNMISEEETMTETDDVLTDYSQLEYKSLRKRPIMVAIVFPTMEEKIFKRYDGTFIGLNTSLDFTKSRAYSFIQKTFRSIWNKG